VRDLLMVIPSRGRPQNIERLLDAMAATCEGQTDLVVGLDADDETLGDYPGMNGDAAFDGKVHYVVRENLRKVTAWCNELAVPRAQDYRYIGHFGDDNLPQTPGWDVQMMNALEQTPFAFGNDQYPGRAPGTLACHVFMLSEVVRTLGYFGPPEIAHMYVDVAWQAWGQACGITYLHDVNLEHRHYTTGRSGLDDTYRNSYAGTGADLASWHSYCRSGRLNADIEKLGGRPYSPGEIVGFNRALFIPEG
jgi:hypothetical protein